MFYLHVANRTEELLQQLAAVTEEDAQPSLVRELLLVQSQGMERVVCQGLAELLGVFCNYRFFFPLEFLHFVAEQLEPGLSPDGFDRSILVWRLEALLRDIDSAVYQPLAAYLQGEDVASRRFQLAGRLANCFDQYQLMRVAMVLGWQQGRLATSSDSEKWQMALWQRLIAQEGGDMHRAQLFARVTEMLQQAGEGTLSAILPHRISVFGVHTLPPVFLQFLAGFARHGNVHFYLLSPCRQYWGDLKSWRAQLQQWRRSGGQPQEKPVGHPLLASLGCQGGDLQSIMAEMDISMEFASYVDPVDIAGKSGRQPTLLEVLQQDLLDGEIATDVAVTDDGSLRIVSCHSRVRELEVLREHLLQLLQEEELSLRQIVVMAPDIQQYTPFISTIFYDIEHSVADRSLQSRQPAIATFSFFLSLFTGKFGRSAVLELLQCQGVAERFLLTSQDVETIVRWTETAGIRWGLSADQRQGAGAASFTGGSFRAGLERLLMGYAIGCDDFALDILPVTDVEGKQAQALGGFCQFIDFLEQSFYSFQQPRSLGSWRDLLLSCAEQLLPADDSSGWMELRAQLFSLGESEHFTGKNDIDFSAIYKWFTMKISESRSGSGFLRGQLTFCSMLPMRSIPFQVICLLGLDDGLFPRNDQRDTFDLLAYSPQRGDRSPANDDRYQFLEAILAARHTLYLSYIGQSEKSGDSVPPSVIIAELLDLLASGYGLEMEPVAQPLYPFAAGYFDGSSSSLFSYSEENLQIARARQDGGLPGSEKKSGIFPWWRGRLSLQQQSVCCDSLFAFYKDPPSWFVRTIVGVALDFGEAVSEDSEIFTASPLFQYMLDRELFIKMFYQQRGWSERKLLHYFQQSGQWPLGVSGALEFHHSFEKTDAFIARLETLDLGSRIDDLPLAVMPCSDTAQLAVTGRITDRYERGNLVIFHSKLKGWHLLSAWLWHLLENLSRQTPRPTWLFTTTDSGCFRALPQRELPTLSHLLQLWQKGCRAPLPLYTEPAFAWAKAAAGGEKAALAKAVRKAEAMWDYRPEWGLLLGSKERIEESIDNVEFYRYTKEIMAPLYSFFKQECG